jgi:integrase
LRRLWRGEPGKLEAPTVAATATLAPTLRAILAEYLESRSLSHSANADLRSIVKKHAALWIDKPIDALEPRSIAQKYRTLASDHPAPANRLLGALSALAKYAHAAHGVGDANVIVRARSLLGATEKVEARDVVIGDDVQAAWAKAVSAEAAPVRRYLRALMLTGLRANELRKLPRDGWDTDSAVLRIAMTKNGKSHSLPCGDVLRKLLDDEVKASSDAACLFNVPVKVYRAACDRIGKAIGFDWHLHDIRRSFATVATRAGVDAGMVKRLMNHSANGDVTQRHYIRLDIEDLRPSMKTVETYLTALWADSASALTSTQQVPISPPKWLQAQEKHRFIALPCDRSVNRSCACQPVRQPRPFPLGCSGPWPLAWALVPA